MSLREKQMAQRRARMLSAAQKLIRRTGGTDFTMSALSAEAEVAPATPFNVFGSKEALLYELLLQTLREFFSRAAVLRVEDPVECVVSAAQAAVEVFAENPKQLRPLYRFLLGVNDPKSRPEFLRRSREYWRKSLEPAVQTNLLDAIQADAIASSLVAHILGLLDLWVHENVSDIEFATQLKIGVLMHLAPFIRPKQIAQHRSRIVNAIESSSSSA